MKSKWMVMSNLINGDTEYFAYRILNTDEPDHAGNREIFPRGYIMGSRAKDLANLLNNITPEQAEVMIRILKEKLN